MDVATTAGAPPEAPAEPRRGDLSKLTAGDRLWVLRWWVEASQKEFAHAFGLHPSTLRRYEAKDGRPPAELVERISKTLNLGDFMTAEDGPLPSFAEKQRIRFTWNLSHISRDQAGNLLSLIDEIQEQLAHRRKVRQRSAARP